MRTAAQGGVHAKGGRRDGALGDVDALSDSAARTGVFPGGGSGGSDGAADHRAGGSRTDAGASHRSGSLAAGATRQSSRASGPIVESGWGADPVGDWGVEGSENTGSGGGE